MKYFAAPALVIGLAAATLLIGHYGFAAVAGALLSLGWTGFSAIVAFHLAMIAICGLAWFALVPSSHRPAAWVFVWGRLVRNGGSDVLPLSQLGGVILGARAAALAGLSGRMSVASTVVDVTMELLSQLAYVALALAIFVTLRPGSGLLPSLAGGLAAAATLAALCVLAQRQGLPVVKRLAGGLARRWNAAADAIAVPAALDEIYGRRRAVAAGFALHLVAWIASSAELWIALQFIGQPLGIGAVVAIEGLLCAAQAVAFAVPNAFGVQEGAYLVLGGLFGLGPELALGLSLLRRARDLCLGVPALLAWQLVESRRLWRRRPTGAPAIASEDRPASIPVPVDAA